MENRGQYGSCDSQGHEAVIENRGQYGSSASTVVVPSTMLFKQSKFFSLVEWASDRPKNINNCTYNYQLFTVKFNFILNSDQLVASRLARLPR